MNPTAVIIARFQTPYLHPGHHHLLQTIFGRHNKVVVLLGVTPVKGSHRNPFDFHTRERMLKAAYPTTTILPLADHPLDAAWSDSVDKLLQATFPQERFLLYGSRDSFIPYYTGALPVQELPHSGNHSATHIRHQTADKVLDSTDFRMGINYAYNGLYPKVYPTVDIALLHGSNILLGKKAGRDGWRLPGGFVDPTDESLEAAARRELHEECGLVETGTFSYIGSTLIDDWRYRKEQDKIMTALFATNLVYGIPAAGDDLEATTWFALSDLENEMRKGALVSEHQVLIRMLLTHLAAHPIQDTTNIINLKNAQHEN